VLPLLTSKSSGIEISNARRVAKVLTSAGSDPGLTQQRRPTDGSTHWSTRKLAKELGAPVGFEPTPVDYDQYFAISDVLH
jgi:hypothetical protein